MTIDEYLTEVVIQEIDPQERTREYIAAALELMEQAEEELKRGDLRQASEKIWGAAALAIKAYAYAKEGRRLSSHGELWEYKSKVAEELGDWVHDAWAHANGMHANYYEGWADKESVEIALQRVKVLVKKIAQELNLQVGR